MAVVDVVDDYRVPAGRGIDGGDDGRRGRDDDDGADDEEGGGGEDEEFRKNAAILHVLLSLLCVSCAAVAAGLTLDMLSLDVSLSVWGDDGWWGRVVVRGRSRIASVALFLSGGGGVHHRVCRGR